MEKQPQEEKEELIRKSTNREHKGRQCREGNRENEVQLYEKAQSK